MGKDTDTDHDEHEKHEAKKKARYQVTDSGTYRTQVRDPVTHRRRSITARTASELEARKEGILRVRRDLRYGAIDPRTASVHLSRMTFGGLTVDDVWREYVSTSKKSSRAYLASVWAIHLAPWVKAKSAWEVDELLLRRWAADRIAKGYSPKTVKNIYERLGAAFALAVRLEKLAKLPWGTWRPERPDPAANRREACRSLEEFVLLTQAARDIDGAAWAKGRYADLTYRVFTAGLCGLRNGELGGLGWDCVEIDSVPPMMHVRYQVIPGWGKDGAVRPLDPPKDGYRALVIHPSVHEVLRHQREELKRRGLYRLDGPVFPAPDGGWRRTNMAIDPDQFRKVVERAGLPNTDRWSPHSLRHSFATLEVVASGGDLRSTQARTGHSSVKMLETYLHAAGRGLPHSRIPALPAHLLPQPVEASGAPPVTATGNGPDVSTMPYASGTLVDLALSTQARAAEFEAQRTEEKRAAGLQRFKRENGNLVELADELGAAELARLDAEGERPKAVREAAEKRYRKAYMAALRAGGGEVQARAAGMRSKRAFLGQWGQTARRVIKAGLCHCSNG